MQPDGPHANTPRRSWFGKGLDEARHVAFRMFISVTGDCTEMAYRLGGALEAPEGRGGLAVPRLRGPGVEAPRSVSAAAAWRRCRAGLRAQRLSEDEQGVGGDSTTLSPPLSRSRRGRRPCTCVYLLLFLFLFSLILSP